MWESCERQVEELGLRLQELKARIEDPLPTEDDDLPSAMEHAKVTSCEQLLNLV